MSSLVEKALAILGLDEVVTKALTILIQFQPKAQDVRDLLALANLSEDDIAEVTRLASFLTNVRLQSVEDVFAAVSEFFDKEAAS